ISSHALHQKRVSGVMLDSAVFTNITPEHLDYHHDMGSYLKEKKKIFNNLKKGGIAVLNADDPRVAELKNEINCENIITFGINGTADVMAENISLKSHSTGFDMVSPVFGRLRINTGLIGIHNVYNILGAAGALADSGIKPEDMKNAVEQVRPVPGRLETVKSSASFRVFVDYAHTPDALENVLSCLRPLASGKLICVFGCGGDRDRTKRPLMGKIAADLCDSVILTNDNPRTEKPIDILREIEKGMAGEKSYSIIEDRETAIRQALLQADTGSIVLIAGKGHEDYQILGGKTVHFDDRETAVKILREMGY
ncbi:MAG: UDP-N-acetylmuramoyl-L-alanyl-D-glutamate--2,6-diaminopimelate ligase, partial [Candidatus Omnitrophota bacterium]